MKKTEILDGIEEEPTENERLIYKKCTHILLKAISVFLVGAVFIGYFIAVSRDSNLQGNFPEFDVGNVTDSSITGKFLGQYVSADGKCANICIFRIHRYNKLFAYHQ